MKKVLLVLTSLVIIVCLGGILGAIAQVQPRYSYIDLGTLGGNNTYISVANDVGQVVGESQTSNLDVDHAFLWNSPGPMTDLGPLSAELDRSNAWCTDPNGNLVVGDAWNADYQNGGPAPMIHAYYRLASSGTMVDLGTLGGTNSSAYGCNYTVTVAGADNVGYIVGQAQNTRGYYHAFYWATNAQSLHNIDNRTGNTYLNSAAWAVNRLGEIVGWAEKTKGSGIYQAFLRKTSGGLKLLPMLSGGAASAAYGINTWAICGQSANALGQTRAVMWFLYRPGVILDLGSLGGNTCYAFALNDWGQVVGTSETSTPGTYHAFLFNDTEGMLDLNDPAIVGTLPAGVTIAEAASVNDYGQILAAAVDSDYTYHVYLLKPNQSYVGTPATIVKANQLTPLLQQVHQLKPIAH